MKTINFKRTLGIIAPLLLTFGVINIVNSNTIGRETNPEEFQTKIVNNLYTIEEIAIGTNVNNNFSGAIINDGTNDVLYMWGDNSNGKLGIGSSESTINTPTAVDINGDGNPYNEGQLTNLSLGSNHGGVVVDGTSSDTLYTWGDNSYGQLGVNKYSDYSTATPEKVGSWDSIKDVSFYDNDSAMVIDTNSGGDQLYTWGDNAAGQIGNNLTGGTKNSPERISLATFNNDEITHLSNNGTTMSASVVIDGANDQLYSWGLNSSGQLGTNDIWSADSPTRIDINSNGTYGDEGKITQLSGDNGSQGVVVNKAGYETLYTVGLNDVGQLGTGNYTNSSSYQKSNLNIQTNHHVTALNMRFDRSSSAVIDNKELYTWGLATSGQLGITAPSEKGIFDIGVSTPFLVNTSSIVDDQTTIDEIITGGKSLMILTNNGTNQTTYGTGNNFHNELGLTTNTDNVWGLNQTFISTHNPEIVDSGITINQITTNSANVNYDFKLNGAKATKISLYLNGTFIEADTTPTVANDHLTGSFTLNDLNVYSDYNVKIEVEYSQPNFNLITTGEAETNFTTSKAAVVKPTIEITNSTNNLSADSATFDVAINYGNDVANEDWNVKSYRVYDENNNQIDESNIINNGNGHFTIINLEQATIYQNWTVSTIFTSSNQTRKIVNQSSIPEFSTVNQSAAATNGIGYWVYGLIALVSVLVIIGVVFAFIWF